MFSRFVRSWLPSNWKSENWKWFNWGTKKILLISQKFASFGVLSNYILSSSDCRSWWVFSMLFCSSSVVRSTFFFLKDNSETIEPSWNILHRNDLSVVFYWLKLQKESHFMPNWFLWQLKGKTSKLFFTEIIWHECFLDYFQCKLRNLLQSMRKHGHQRANISGWLQHRLKSLLISQVSATCPFCSVFHLLCPDNMYYIFFSLFHSRAV